MIIYFSDSTVRIRRLFCPSFGIPAYQQHHLCQSQSLQSLLQYYKVLAFLITTERDSVAPSLFHYSEDKKKKKVKWNVHNFKESSLFDPGNQKSHEYKWYMGHPQNRWSSFVTLQVQGRHPKPRGNGAEPERSRGWGPICVWHQPRVWAETQGSRGASPPCLGRAGLRGPAGTERLLGDAPGLGGVSYLGRGGRRISGGGLESSSGLAPAGVTAQQAGPPPPAHPPPPTAAGPERGLDGRWSPRVPSASKGGGGGCGCCCGPPRAAALVPAPAPPPAAAAAASSPPLP